MSNRPFLFYLWLVLLGAVPSFVQAQGAPSTSVSRSSSSAQGLVAPEESSLGFSGQVFAVIVGISEYKNLTPLVYADDDACLFQQYLQSKGGGSVPDSNMVVFLNEKATESNVLEGLMATTKRVQKGDRIYIYLAGHGVAKPNYYDDAYENYLLGYDCAKENEQTVSTFGATIPIQEVKKAIGKFMKNGVQVMLVLDACRNVDPPILGGEWGNFYQDQITQSKGEFLFLATGAGAVAYERSDIGGGHGLFTFYLVKGLAGAADTDEDQTVSFEELNRFVYTNVFQSTNKNQEPTFVLPNNQKRSLPLSKVDTLFTFQRSDCNLPTNKPGISSERGLSVVLDTSGTQWLEQLKQAVAEYHFKGENGAQGLLDSLLACCPNSVRLKEAKKVLALGYLDFGQELLNRYLTGDDSRLFTRSLLNPSKERASLQAQLSNRHQELSQKIKKFSKKRSKKYKKKVKAWKLERKRLKQLLMHCDSLQVQEQNRLERLQEANFTETASWMRTALEWIDQDSFLYSVYHRKISLMDLYGAQGDLADSTRLPLLLDSLITLDSAAVFLNLAGKTWTRLGKYGQAAESLQWAMKKAKKWAYPYNNFGELMDVQDRYSEAEGWYRQAIALDSSFVYADNNLALNLERQDRGEEALAVYEAALAKDIAYFMTYNNLGQYYLKMGDAEQAMAYFIKAVELNPRDPFSTENLLNRYLAEEEMDEVEVWSERARNLRKEIVIVPSSSHLPPKAEVVVDKAERRDGKRIALVIGNANYQYATPLKTPVNDAELMERTLRELNFEVITINNAMLHEMERALVDFTSKIESKNCEVAFCYFSGYGLEVNGSNYLMPVDANLGRQSDVKYSCLDVQQILDGMGNANAVVKILILDACRENPLLSRLPRILEGGLVALTAPKGTLIAYASAPGSKAWDGEGANSPYTAALARYMKEPGLEIGQVMRRTSEATMVSAMRVGMEQIPFVFNSLSKDLFLVPLQKGLVTSWKPYLKSSIPVSVNDDPLVGKMILVKGGTFEMGCTWEQEGCKNDEKPVHRVTLGDYYLGESEVTQAQWRAVMGNNPSYNSGCDQCPVEQVSWEDIQKYLKKLNSLNKEGEYRLPTEAEWEYAARGGRGSRGYPYSGINTLKEVGWYESNSGNNTHLVKGKRSNELGLYDMSGNVWEWCSDWYGDYSSGAQTNPMGPASGSKRVVRGGSWFDHPTYCRVSSRGKFEQVSSSGSLGFRLARTF